MKTLPLMLCGLLIMGGANAAVDNKTAQQLDQNLTPVGAERAGNVSGTIPEWTGGITTPPPGYIAGEHHPDPYPEDQPLYEITRDNLATYKTILSAGSIALLNQYPDYRLQVYPTRRSAALPYRIYQDTRANATSAELTYRGNGVQGAASGIPFPVPKDGLEAIWNHILRYRGETLDATTNRTVVNPNGSYSLVKINKQVYFVYGREGNTTDDIDNKLFYYKHKVTAPASLAGTALLVNEPLDQIASVRKAWQYIPGQRRVRRLPKLAYNDLMPDTSGMLTADTADMFNGAPDRYEWTLTDKREMLVPYNSYKVHGKDVKYSDILTPYTLNPELLRYERHRVWIVDAKLRTGYKHPYAKRRFYIDEDSWQILMVDLYDANDKLIRFQEAHPVNYYEVPLMLSTLEVIYDLEGQRYFVDGLNNQESEYNFSATASPRNFTASALRRENRK